MVSTYAVGRLRSGPARTLLRLRRVSQQPVLSMLFHAKACVIEVLSDLPERWSAAVSKWLPRRSFARASAGCPRRSNTKAPERPPVIRSPTEMARTSYDMRRFGTPNIPGRLSRISGRVVFIGASSGRRLVVESIPVFRIQDDERRGVILSRLFSFLSLISDRTCCIRHIRHPRTQNGHWERS